MPFAISSWTGIVMMAALALLPALLFSPEALLECFVTYSISFGLAASVWSLWSTSLQILTNPTKLPSFRLLSSLFGSCGFLEFFGYDGFLFPVLLTIVWLLALVRSMCLAVWYGRPFLPTSRYDNLQDQVDDLRKETSGLRTYFNASVASLTANVTRLAIQVHGKDGDLVRLRSCSNYTIENLRRELAIAKKEAKLQQKLSDKLAQDSLKLRRQQIEIAFDAYCQELRDAFDSHRAQFNDSLSDRRQQLEKVFDERHKQLEREFRKDRKVLHAEVAKHRSSLDAIVARRPQDMACDVFDRLAAQHFFGERLNLKSEVQELKRRLNECGSSDLQRHVSEKLAVKDEVKILQDRLSILSSLPAQIEMLSVVSDESSYALEWELEIARQERNDRDLTIMELQAKLQDLNREMEESSAKLHEKADAFKDQSYQHQAARDTAEDRLERSTAALRNVAKERDEFKAKVDRLEEELKRRNSCCQCECPCCPLGCSAGAPPVASPSPIVQAPVPAPIPSPSPVLSPAPVVPSQVLSPDAALVDENALLRGQLASFQQLVDSLQQQTSVSQQRIADLQLENDNFRAQGASLAQQLAPADERYRQMESQVSSSEASLSSVLHQLEVANSRNSQLEEQLSRQAPPAAQVSPSQDEVDQARKRAEQAEVKAKQLQTDLEEQRNQDAMDHGMAMNERGAEIIRLQGEIASLRTSMGQLIADKAQATNRDTKAVDALKKECNGLQLEINRLRRDNDNYFRDLQVAEDVVADQLPDAERLFERIDELEQQVNRGLADLEAANAEIGRLNRELEEYDYDEVDEDGYDGYDEYPSEDDEPCASGDEGGPAASYDGSSDKEPSETASDIDRQLNIYGDD